MKKEPDGGTPLADEMRLVRASRRGDEAAFTELVTRHQRKVFALCYRFLNEAQEASDCAQETFLKAYQGLRWFRQEANFSTWLYRIAANTCLNRLSSPWARWRKRFARPFDGDQEEYRAPDPPDRRPSPAREFARTERAERVRAAIRSLPEEHRLVVVLRDIEGYSYEEIAGMLRLKPGTVKSRLARARGTLQEQLEGVMTDDL